MSQVGARSDGGDSFSRGNPVIAVMNRKVGVVLARAMPVAASSRASASFVSGDWHAKASPPPAAFTVMADNFPPDWQLRRMLGGDSNFHRAALLQNRAAPLPIPGPRTRSTSGAGETTAGFAETRGELTLRAVPIAPESRTCLTNPVVTARWTAPSGTIVSFGAAGKLPRRVIRHGSLTRDGVG